MQIAHIHMPGDTTASGEEGRARGVEDDFGVPAADRLSGVLGLR